MNQFICDSCGKTTSLRPKIELIYEEKDGKKIPKLKKVLKNGEEILTQEYRDLEERAYLVRLSCGDEWIQKDFCKECLDKILPVIQQLWDILNSYKSC